MTVITTAETIVVIVIGVLVLGSGFAMGRLSK